MKLWEKIKSIFSKKGQKLLTEGNTNTIDNEEKAEKTFKDLLSESANIGLSEEQLKTKYAMALGLSMDLLNLPGLKDRVFNHDIFSKIKDNESFNAEKNGIKENLDIQVKKENGTTKITIMDNNNKCTIGIYKDNLNTIVDLISRNYQGIKREKSRFNENDIEVERIVEETLDNGNTKQTEQMIRKGTEKVEVTSTRESFGNKMYETKTNLDISYGEGDIATLDNCGSAYTHNHSKSIRVHLYDESEYKNDRKIRIEKKIAQSKYSEAMKKEYEPFDIYNSGAPTLRR